MSWPAEHPGPWSFDYNEDTPVILDADGDPVVAVDSIYQPPDPETARAIVDAMNGRATLLAERDTLRRLVGRLAQRIQFARLADPNPGGEDPLLREAAAVCKKKKGGGET